ncbi:MAG: branched-chain amino acid ABC transporter permease [Lautropia sp.]
MSELWLNALANGLMIGAIYALVATGLNVIFGVMKVVNFAHGEMVVIGMYVGYGAWSIGGLPPVAGVAIATVVLFGFGYLFQRTIGTRFVSKPAHVQFVLFIGLALTITGLHAMLFGPDPRAIQSAASFEVYRLGALRLDAVRLHAALAALALIAALFAWLRSSMTGKSLHAAAENLVGGKAIGIRIEHVFALTMGIGAACAGAAGALLASLYDTQPYLAAEFTMIAFIIVIIGGLASLPGALLGSLLVGVSEAVAAIVLTPSAKSLFSYGLLIVVLLLRPAGLLGAAPSTRG